MSTQKQELRENSLAVQAGGNVTITGGLTRADLQEIMQLLSSHVEIFEKKALEVANKRIADFQEKVLKRFATDDSAKSEAFSDPDFQHVVVRAQHAQARTSDPRISDTLVDLIAERSKHSARSRISLSLNDAVEKASVLTGNEFAELSLIFILRFSIGLDVKDIQTLRVFLERQAYPLLSDVSREGTSYQYLQSHGCAYSLASGRKLIDQLKFTYGGALSSGFDGLETFKTIDSSKTPILENAGILVTNSAGRSLLNVSGKSDFGEKCRSLGLDDQFVNRTWRHYEKSMPDEQQLVAQLTDSSGNAKLLFDLWDNTLINRLALTTTGFAIAHANLRRVTGFGANLSIWIK